MDEQAEEIEAPICGCKNIFRRDILEYFSQPNARFDEYIAKTGAGTDCSACMLDVELISNDANAERFRQESRASRKEVPNKPARKFSGRWANIDRFSPQVSSRLRGLMPMFVRADVKQSLIVANNGLAFRDAPKAPPMLLKTVVRNADGRQVNTKEFRVDQDQELWMDISELLTGVEKPDTSDLPDMASIWMEYSYLDDGYRGSTRPNMSLETIGGVACVHSQYTIPAELESVIRFVMLPEKSRYFASVVSAEKNRPLNGVFDMYDSRNERIQTINVTVPPLGTRLVEIPQPIEMDEQFGTLVCRFDGERRTHFVASSLDLSQFSIDHF